MLYLKRRLGDAELLVIARKQGATSPVAPAHFFATILFLSNFRPFVVNVGETPSKRDFSVFGCDREHAFH
jgi:hypothetical protein